MAKPKLEDITVRDASLRFLNFEGRKDIYDEAPGKRRFRLMLPEEVAVGMAKEGWNVKQTKPGRNMTPEDVANFEPQPYVEVAVSYKYDNLAPKISLISDGVQTLLTQDTAFLVDQAEILRVDLTINASYWEGLGGSSGFKAYLTEAYITVRESELAKEYAHIPIAGTTRVG